MKGLTPVKAIRRKCLECSNRKMIRECPEAACPLFIYRMGCNPARKRIGGNPKYTLLSKKQAT